MWSLPRASPWRQLISNVSHPQVSAMTWVYVWVSGNSKTQSTGLWQVCPEDRHHHLFYWQGLPLRQALPWLRPAPPHHSSPHQAKQQLAYIDNHTPGRCCPGRQWLPKLMSWSGNPGAFARTQLANVYSEVPPLSATVHHGLMWCFLHS